MISRRSMGGIFLGLVLAVSRVGAAEDPWRVCPSADTVGKAVKDYTPTFEKHFSVKDGVLTGRCALGEKFWEDHGVKSVFEGVGQIWATNTSWPTDAADVELTFDYKWFQDEPMKKYGDFPDMNVGFRLNAEGLGYYVRWGMLGDVLIYRMTGEHDFVIGRGLLSGLKDKWVKVRVLAAGPVIKVKMWPADKGEPDTWSVEAFDDWSGTAERNYRKGRAALGFSGRRLFDTCVYEFTHAALRVLTPDEVKTEAFFAGKTAPPWKGHVGSTAAAKEKLPDVTETLRNADGWTKDENLQIVGSGEEGLTIRSKDGNPAFLWKDAGTDLRTVDARVKSTKGARPLLALRVTAKEGPSVTGYLDPSWREGIAALLYQNASHTASANRFDWKDDAWYDFAFSAGHWHKWFIVETGKDENRAAFAADLTSQWHRSPKAVGVGVAGKDGTVVVKGVFVK